MANTSATEQARELLGYCLRGEPWPEALIEQVIEGAVADPEGSRALFTIVVERLGDLFEPRLCDVYAQLLTRAIERVDPELRREDLLDRYSRVRIPRPCSADPLNVFVLSRITLGADVVVTSTVLDAASRRFPHANIWFVGPRKNWALFGGNDRVSLLATDYPRGGTLAERIGMWRKLRAGFDTPGSIVIDPDSRLTQLGLLPVCPEDRYFFFESRGCGGESTDTLRSLTQRWVTEVFGVDNARPFVAPAAPGRERYDVTLSLGVGENAEKRVADPFERQLLESLAGRDTVVDKGPGGDEAARVERAIAGLPHVRTWSGDYAPFANMVANSRVYIGYDSAGQHVAAAAGIPLISIFAGYASERMFQRWRPTGHDRIQVVKVTPGESPESVLERVRTVLP